MPKVAFVIPASPTRAFFAQIAAISLALGRLAWRDWEPSLVMCLGGEPDAEALRDFLPYLRDVATVFVPPALAEATPWYFAQYDALHRWAPRDADVVVRMDADTLPVGDFEDLLDHVARTGCIAGVIAHGKFPGWPGVTSREAWQRIAAGLIDAPLDFAHAYSLAGAELVDDDRVTPFYVNFGAVFFPRAGFDRVSERYLALRPQVMERLPEPYFAGQVALALVVAEIGAATCALPMRYNFPNDELAAERFPEELQEVRIFHYLRTDAVDRQRIFADAEGYRAFLEAPLTGVDGAFRDHVRRVIGDEYPFAATPGPAPGAAWPPAPAAADPRSPQAYAAAVAEHQRRVAPALAEVEGALAALAKYQAEAAPPNRAASAPPDYAAQFEASGRIALEPLMRFKQALVARFGIERGFAVYRERLMLPDTGRVRLRPLQSQLAFARAHSAAFVETDPGGAPFTVEPPAVVGEGDRLPLRHVSRCLYVACLADARVRGRSAVIEAGGAALLDYQGNERTLFDCELDIDPAIFDAARERAWIVEPDDDEAGIEVDEAFMLLGPNAGSFGDWMSEFLPRYVAADASGALPPVPLLIDANLPATIRQSLAMMAPPGVRTIEVAPYTTVRVRKLWCAPSLCFAPGREKMDRRFKWDYLAPAPAASAAVAREMAGRAVAFGRDAGGPERVFLGRRPAGWRKLVNSEAIEAAARNRGFQIVYPEDLDFAAQADLLRHAHFVVAPEGSALFLAYFARPGTKICILNHTLIDGAIGYNGLFDRVLITILTGPIVRPDAQFPHRADYRIDADAFGAFLDEWVSDGGVRPGAADTDDAGGAGDIASRLAVPRAADLLPELVDISVKSFGAYDEYYLETVMMQPWVAAKLENLPPGSRALDIGAGISPMPLFLAGRGVAVDCVDPSEIIRTLPLNENWNSWGFFDYSKLDENIQSFNCAIEEFTPAEGYDAIYSIGCAAHLSRAARERTFGRCYGWLRPGGRMLHSFDVIPGSDFIWNYLLGQELEPRTTHGTVDDVIQHLVALGFRVIEPRVLRAIPDALTDLLLIECVKD